MPGKLPWTIDSSGFRDKTVEVVDHLLANFLLVRIGGVGKSGKGRASIPTRGCPWLTVIGLASAGQRPLVASMGPYRS